MTTETLELWQAVAAGNRGMAQAAANAGPAFIDKARAFVLSELGRRGPLSGEVLTDCCKLAGIIPHSDRAFGAVYMSLSKRGLIVKCGYGPRRKGHACAGAITWCLANPPI